MVARVVRREALGVKTSQRDRAPAASAAPELGGSAAATPAVGTATFWILEYLAHLPLDSEGIFKPQGTQVLGNDFTPDGSGPGALALLSSTSRLRCTAFNDSKSFDNAVASNDDSHSHSQPM